MKFKNKTQKYAKINLAYCGALLAIFRRRKKHRRETNSRNSFRFEAKL